jgi:hypothetical protein
MADRQPDASANCSQAALRFVTPPPREWVVSQSGAPWGVVSNKPMCGVWCSDDLKKRPLILFTSNYHLFIAT